MGQTIQQRQLKTIEKAHAAIARMSETVIRVRTLYTSGIGWEKLKTDFDLSDTTLIAILRGDFGRGAYPSGTTDDLTN